MARTRRSQTGDATSGNGSTQAGGFTCPECGKTFARAASLGAHRRAAHGIAGAKAAARGSGRRRVTRRRAPTSATRRAGTAARATTRGHADGINRDALLSALFPNGMPAREEVIRSVNQWLDEAERLAKLR
jgi:hypothetical protein